MRLPLWNGPHAVFRYVHREDRAAYRRIMRRTMAVQVRDINRAFAQMTRVIGKSLRPVFERLAEVMSK